jgi:hypothetical protein
MNGAAVERVREALAEHGCAPRGPNTKLRAKCPVHGSHGPTLAVSQGKAGAVLYCHAACETLDVLAAIGLTFPDLYDEPPKRGRYPVRVVPRKPSSYEEIGRVLARAAEICALREAMQDEAPAGPRLTVDERVERAEEMCREEARHHYWRTLARWACMATDKDTVVQAHRARDAWMNRELIDGKPAPAPTHEQFMVLTFRAEDLERTR